MPFPVYYTRTIRSLACAIFILAQQKYPFCTPVLPRTAVFWYLYSSLCFKKQCAFSLAFHRNHRFHSMLHVGAGLSTHCHLAQIFLKRSFFFYFQTSCWAFSPTSVATMVSPTSEANPILPLVFNFVATLHLFHFCIRPYNKLSWKGQMRHCILNQQVNFLMLPHGLDLKSLGTENV